MINGYLLADDVVVLWDTQDVTRLRMRHRITGSLIGSLPTQPKQNNEFGLPLVLQPEETTLLVEQGVLVLKKSTCHFQTLSSTVIESLKAAFYPELLHTGEDPLQSNVHSPLISIYTKYIIPSAESLPTTVNKETKESCNDVQDSSCTISGGLDDGGRNSSVSWNWPKTNEQILKYRVFKDLWQKGFYITPGLKFGGEYLVYESDPLMVHASFITKIVNWDNLITTNQLATAVRLGGKVKKRTLLCSINPMNSSVEYLTLHWTGMAYNKSNLACNN